MSPAKLQSSYKCCSVKGNASCQRTVTVRLTGLSRLDCKKRNFVMPKLCFCLYKRQQDGGSCFVVGASPALTLADKRTSISDRRLSCCGNRSTASTDDDLKSM